MIMNLVLACDGAPDGGGEGGDLLPEVQVGDPEQNLQDQDNDCDRDGGGNSSFEDFEEGSEG